MTNRIHSIMVSTQYARLKVTVLRPSESGPVERYKFTEYRNITWASSNRLEKLAHTDYYFGAVITPWGVTVHIRPRKEANQ